MQLGVGVGEKRRDQLRGGGGPGATLGRWSIPRQLAWWFPTPSYIYYGARLKAPANFHGAAAEPGVTSEDCQRPSLQIWGWKTGNLGCL